MASRDPPPKLSKIDLWTLPQDIFLAGGRLKQNGSSWVLQEEPGGARRGQEGPGGARRGQEGPGGVRRTQEDPGGARNNISCIISGDVLKQKPNKAPTKGLKKAKDIILEEGVLPGHRLEPCRSKIIIFVQPLLPRKRGP